MRMTMNADLTLIPTALGTVCSLLVVILQSHQSYTRWEVQQSRWASFAMPQLTPDSADLAHCCWCYCSFDTYFVPSRGSFLLSTKSCLNYWLKSHSRQEKPVYMCLKPNETVFNSLSGCACVYLFHDNLLSLGCLVCHLDICGSE